MCSSSSMKMDNWTTPSREREISMLPQICSSTIMNSSPKFIKAAILLLMLTLACVDNFSFSQTLVAHYRFDNDASDISGNKNHGRIIGGVESTPDRFGSPCGA